MPSKFRFRTDGDGHWYLIPAELSTMFSQMLDDGEEDYYCEFNNKFEEYRCDCPSNYTVENPE